MNHRIGSALLAATFAVLAPLATFAATLTLPAGSQMNVTINSTIDSHSAQVGDHFTANVQPPYPLDNQGLAGAVVTGTLISVQHAGQGTKPAIAIRFDSIRLADGSTASMDAFVASAQPKTQAKNGARVAISTIGGMLIGNAIAKTVFGAKGGGIAGAAGGFLIGNNYKADIQFPQGSSMLVQMKHTLAIRRQPQKH